MRLPLRSAPHPLQPPPPASTGADRAPRGPLRFLLLCLLLSLLARPVPAWALEEVPPGLRWQTLSTPHFTLTWHTGEEQLAQETARRLEAIHAALSLELGWSPRRKVHILLLDAQDDANGYASPLPYHHIVLYPAAPEAGSSLDGYDDWLTLLIAHEYTHILHMDRVGGLPALARRVAGTVIVPNALAPRWVLEGLATLEETRQTSGGRGRASYTAMILRMAALEGVFPHLDEAEGFGSAWPGGHQPYLFGVAFMQWVAAQHGPDVWARVVERQGRMVIPYLIGLRIRRETGRSLHGLWQAWQQDVTSQAQAFALSRQALGLTSARLITDGRGHVQGFGLSPDGQRLVYSVSPENGPSRVLSQELATGRTQRLDSGRAPRAFTFTPDGQGVLFSAPARYDRFTRYDDLYRAELGRHTARKLSKGLRLREPALSPDGKTLVAVINRTGQTNLRRITRPEGFGPHPGQPPEPLNATSLEALTQRQDFTQAALPRFSPDGTRLVYAQRSPERRWQLVELELSSGQSRPITDGQSHALWPAYDPSGDLYFTSDQDGTFQIYRWQRQTGQARAITNLVGGAFQPIPSPDGKTLYFLGYRANGQDVYALDLAQAPLALAPLAQAPLAQATSSLPSQPRSAASATPPAVPPAPSEPLAGSTESPSAPPFPAEVASAPRPLPVPQALLTPPQPATPPALARDVLNPQLPQVVIPEATRYRALPTLAPAYLLPLGYLTEGGAMAGLQTGGADLLLKHSYGLSVHFRSDNQFVGYSLSYVNRQLSTPILASLSQSSVYLGSLPPLEEGDQPGPRYDEIRTRGSLGLRLPLSRVSQGAFSYTYECREPLQALPGDDPLAAWSPLPWHCTPPLTQAPAGYSLDELPSRGRFAGLNLNFRRSNAEWYRRSFSPEHGSYVDVTAQLQHPALGSDYQRVLLTADARAYLGLPAPVRALEGHVLALRGGAGLALGDRLAQPAWRLGGSFGDNPAVLFPSEYKPLRGYPAGSLGGQAYLSGTLEYRFPLLWLDRGFRDWPLFVRSLSGAAFLDAAGVGEPPTWEGFWDEKQWQSRIQGLKLGMGLELHSSLVLSHGYGMLVRAGVAWGLGEGGSIPPDAGAWYLELGSAF